MHKGNTEIYISKVSQKAFVKVNKQGAEAADSTIIEMTFSGIEPEIKSLNDNIHFLYFIMLLCIMKVILLF